MHVLVRSLVVLSPTLMVFEILSPCKYMLVLVFTSKSMLDEVIHPDIHDEEEEKEARARISGYIHMLISALRR